MIQLVSSVLRMSLAGLSRSPGISYYGVAVMVWLQGSDLLQVPDILNRELRRTSGVAAAPMIDLKERRQDTLHRVGVGQ